MGLFKNCSGLFTLKQPFAHGGDYGALIGSSEPSQRLDGRYAQRLFERGVFGQGDQFGYAVVVAVEAELGDFAQAPLHLVLRVADEFERFRLFGLLVGYALQPFL